MKRLILVVLLVACMISFTNTAHTCGNKNAGNKKCVSPAKLALQVKMARYAVKVASAKLVLQPDYIIGHSFLRF